MIRALNHHWQHKLIILLASLSLFTGCTQKFNDVSATAAEAYSNYIDIDLSAEEIRSVPYASAYLKLGKQKQVFVVLAFAEKDPVSGQTQLKWVSADKAMVVTENGRIVKTLGLQNDNLALRSGPLPLFSPAEENISYPLTYDWMPDYRYSFPAQSELEAKETTQLVTPLYTADVTLYEETILFPTLDTSINNQYWVDKAGVVLKTRQYLGPKMIPVEMTFLKTYAEK